MVKDHIYLKMGKDMRDLYNLELNVEKVVIIMLTVTNIKGSGYNIYIYYIGK